jgi:hypothetical protein
MSLRTSASNLTETLKLVTLGWERTRETWTDVKSREFAAAYLDELPQQIARAAQVIEELDSVLRKIKADCE